MKSQATRIEPAKQESSRGEVLCVMLCGVSAGVGIALFQALTWIPFK